MKQFKCGDVVPGCQWVTRSEDEKELFLQIADQVKNVEASPQPNRTKNDEDEDERCQPDRPD